MNTAKQALFLCCALAGLTYFAWYFASTGSQALLDTKSLESTPDVIIHQLTVHQYDKNGHLHHRLEASLMHHIPLNNTTWLKTPLIRFAQINQPSMTIEAEQATALHGNEQITFKDNVIIHQEKQASMSPSTLTTTELTYYTKTQLAISHVPIYWERIGSTVHAAGMSANLATNRIQLRDARGTYEPTHG